LQCHIPAKSESTYMSRENFVEGCMMMPHDFVACKYLMHWWMAMLRSG